jgi:hypothetical protein
MKEETINKFKEYDFSGDARWQDYLKAIYPMPPIDKLNKMKKRWYKNNVDQEFDPEADLDAPAPQPQPSQNFENIRITNTNRHTANKRFQLDHSQQISCTTSKAF